MNTLVYEFQVIKEGEAQKLQEQQAPIFSGEMTLSGEKKWLTVPETAIFLGISTSTLYKKKSIRRHKLPGGKNNFYNVDELKMVRCPVKTTKELEAEAAVLLATSRKGGAI